MPMALHPKRHSFFASAVNFVPKRSTLLHPPRLVRHHLYLGPATSHRTQQAAAPLGKMHLLHHLTLDLLTRLLSHPDQTRHDHQLHLWDQAITLMTVRIRKTATFIYSVIGTHNIHLGMGFQALKRLAR